MREIATRIDSLASTELTYSADATSTGMTSNDASSSAASSTPADTFASGLLRSIFAQIARWLANAANGIESIFAKVGNFGKVNTDELCVGGTCVSSMQFQAMVAAVGQSHAAANTNGSEEPPPMSSSPADATNTPPVIRINGNNPAHINVGNTYQDLGATAKDNEGHDLGVKTFLNGALVSDIVLDTSTTSIIDYVATDTWGNTATATRSVIIKSPAPPVTDSDPVPAAVPDATPLAPDTATSESLLGHPQRKSSPRPPLQQSNPPLRRATPRRSSNSLAHIATAHLDVNRPFEHAGYPACSNAPCAECRAFPVSGSSARKCRSFTSAFPSLYVASKLFACGKRERRQREAPASFCIAAARVRSRCY